MPIEPTHAVDVFHQIGEMLDSLPDQLQRRVIAALVAGFVGTYDQRVWSLVMAEMVGEINKALQIIAEAEEEEE